MPAITTFPKLTKEDLAKRRHTPRSLAAASKLIAELVGLATRLLAQVEQLESQANYQNRMRASEQEAKEAAQKETNGLREESRRFEVLKRSSPHEAIRFALDRTLQITSAAVGGSPVDVDGPPAMQAAIAMASSVVGPGVESPERQRIRRAHGLHDVAGGLLYALSTLEAVEAGRWDPYDPLRPRS